MSEQNILNPTQGSLFNPDYGYAEGFTEARTTFLSRSGNIFARRNAGVGTVYDLNWSGRDLATKRAFQQWEQQYLDDYFTLADWDSGRYFTGRFAGPLTYSPSGNAAYNIKGQFTELPGAPMYAYPTNWARDAVFLEERNSKGEDLVKLLTPANWTYDHAVVGHGSPPGRYYTGTTNETAEWIYFGYGFRYWANTELVAGIVEVTCTRVRDAVIVDGPTNVDLYSAAGVASAPLHTGASQPLDFYRVKLRCTGTHNPSSTGYLVFADAIEVMR